MSDAIFHERTKKFPFVQISRPNYASWKNGSNPTPTSSWGKRGGNFAPLASARFNCYQSELFQRSGPHFSFRLDASFGAYVCVCVVCLPIHDTDQGEPGLPSKSPNRHHSTCPFWHQRRHCQSVSQSSNLSRLTRARILRQPNVGKRKRDAAAKMGKQECKTKMAGQPLLRVFTRQSAQPRSLSGLLHS